jgi:hypothetical protein
MFSNTFNTTQFVDVSTPRQRAAGNTMFEDLSSPGSYFIETSTGYVYSVHKQRIIINRNGSFDDMINTDQHCLNRRIRNGKTSYETIQNRNMRLARIQYISDQRRRRPSTKTISSTGTVTMKDGTVTTSSNLYSPLTSKQLSYLTIDKNYRV